MKKDDNIEPKCSKNALNDELTLQAWISWKRICSVKGCDRQDRLYLIKDICKHIYDINKDISQNEFIQEFDVCLFAKKINGVKPYKDYLWELVEKSNDPPLRVIRGKLTGPFGIARDVMREYQRKNCSYLWERNKIKDRFTSMDETISNSPDDERTLHDIIPNKSNIDNIEYTTDKQNIAQAIKEYFSPEDAAILIALAAGISLAAPELLNFLKIKKSACYNKAEQVKKKMLDFPWKEIFDLWQNDGNIGYTVIKALIELLKVEKRAESFLIQATDKLL